MVDVDLGAGKWVNGETMFPSPNVAGPQIAALAPFRVAGSYDWKDEHTLEIVLRYIESPHTETMICHIDGNKLSIEDQNSFQYGKGAVTIRGTVQ